MRERRKSAGKGLRRNEKGKMEELGNMGAPLFTVFLRNNELFLVVACSSGSSFCSSCTWSLQPQFDNAARRRLKFREICEFKENNKKIRKIGILDPRLQLSICIDMML